MSMLHRENQKMSRKILYNTKTTEPALYSKQNSVCVVFLEGGRGWKMFDANDYLCHGK